MSTTQNPDIKDISIDQTLALGIANLADKYPQGKKRVNPQKEDHFNAITDDINSYLENHPASKEYDGLHESILLGNYSEAVEMLDIKDEFETAKETLDKVNEG